MALVAKSNPTRNTVTIVLFLAVVVGGALFLFRGSLFPPAAPSTVPVNASSSVPQLPVYPESGASTLNTNTAQVLTPHGDAVIVPCHGRDNPFEPIEGAQGCP